MTTLVSRVTLLAFAVTTCAAGLFADERLELRGEWRADPAEGPRNATERVTFSPVPAAEAPDGPLVNVRAELVVGERRLRFALERLPVARGEVRYRAEVSRKGVLGKLQDELGDALTIEGRWALDPIGGRLLGGWTLSDGQRGDDVLYRFGSGLGWKESPLGGSAEAEAAAIAALEERVKGIQDEVAGVDSRQRGFHNKGFGLRGELRVAADLAPDLRVGPFQPGRTWPVIARFSNAQPKLAHDSKLDQRGLAFRIKTGQRRPLLSGVTEDAQDFLTTNSDVTARDPVQFLDFAELTVKSPLQVGRRLLEKYGHEETLHITKVLAGGTGSPSSMTSEPIWSSRAPLKWGPLAVKVALLPAHTPPRERDGLELPLPIGLGADHLREDLRARLRNGDLVLDVCVQRFDTEETTPIEDASVRWTTPFEQVAELVLVQQDLNEAEARALEAEIEKMAFNPWNCTEDFRPLGSVMRARRSVYKASAEHRGACPFGFGR